jgi:ubiquinol-cytochrome c reductase cytochrome c subunit
MRRLARRIGKHLVAFLAGFGAALLLAASAASAADAAKGKQVYMTTGCYACHGTVGQGGVAGPKLAPEPLPLDAFTGFVRTSNRRMPPYSAAILPDAALADIHAYLASLPPPPDPKGIPLLRQ